MQPIWSVNRPAVVMDCGTGFSKLGFAGNAKPSFVIPTAVGPGAPSSAATTAVAGFGTAGRGAAGGGAGGAPMLSDLDFNIGEEAQAAALLAAGSGVGSGGYGGVSGSFGGGLVFPVRQGVVVDWDAMERFWQKSLFHYLRVDPEEHCVVVTEPPLNPPESREALAEIMFESFNVAGLYVGVQAVLALYAGWATADRADRGRPQQDQEKTKKEEAMTQGPQSAAAGDGAGPLPPPSSSSAFSHPPPLASPTAPAHLTGTVVDVGEGAAHIIPVVEGFVLEGAIKSLPLAGRSVTGVVQQMLRERGEAVPPDQSLELCRRIKEDHCYVAPDMLREFGRYDREPSKYHRTLQLHNHKTGTDFTLDLGYERFLAPEALFTPGTCSSVPLATPSLSRAVDDVIQSCPIDTRRALYGNVVLSGGSTMFKNFGRRLAADLTVATSRRLQAGATAVEISVRSHAMQQFAVWFGGSLVACDPGFASVCHSREQYQEYGPSICRTNYVFKDL